MKKISNRNQAEKIILSARNTIKKLELEGLQIPSDLQNMIKQKIKTRYTTHEVDVLKEHLNPRHLRARAEKLTFPEIRRSYAFYTNKAGTHNFSFSFRNNKNEKKAFARKLYRDINYALTNHPSRDFDMNLRELLITLDFNIKRINFQSLRSQSNWIINDWKQIDKNDFINAVIKKYDMDFTSEFYYRVEQVIGSGRTSETEYKKYKKFSREQAMKSFGETFDMTPELAETIYDFFQNSAEWALYRKNYSPSDDINIGLFFDDIEEAMSLGISVSDIDAIIANNQVKHSTYSARIALEDIIAEKRSALEEALEKATSGN